MLRAGNDADLNFCHSYSPIDCYQNSHRLTPLYIDFYRTSEEAEPACRVDGTNRAGLLGPVQHGDKGKVKT